MNTPVKLTRQIRRAQGRQSPQQQSQRLTDQIITEAAVKAASAAAAAAVTRATLTDAEVQAWRQDLDARLQLIQRNQDQNLGHIEEELARAAKEPLRKLAERAASIQGQRYRLPVSALPPPTERSEASFPPRGLALRFLAPVAALRLV
jgi:hypothetical protein